jgi:hypothetical protein
MEEQLKARFHFSHILQKRVDPMAACQLIPRDSPFRSLRSANKTTQMLPLQSLIRWQISFSNSLLPKWEKIVAKLGTAEAGKIDNANYQYQSREGARGARSLQLNRSITEMKNKLGIWSIEKAKQLQTPVKGKGIQISELNRKIFQLENALRTSWAQFKRKTNVKLK